MAQYELVIQFEDPEPGTVTDPADIAALGRHAEEIMAWLRECTYPFRFTGTGIEQLGEEGPEPELTTAEAQLWNVMVTRKSGDATVRTRINGAPRITCSATLLSVFKLDNVVTRFPLVNVLEWDEIPVTARVPV